MVTPSTAEPAAREYVDFPTPTSGTVLTGKAPLDLRAAVSVLRSAATTAESRTTGSLDRRRFLGRLRAVPRAAEQAAAAVEKVLPTN